MSEPLTAEQVKKQMERVYEHSGTVGAPIAAQKIADSHEALRAEVARLMQELQDAKDMYRGAEIGASKAEAEVTAVTARLDLITAQRNTLADELNQWREYAPVLTTHGFTPPQPEKARP